MEFSLEGCKDFCKNDNNCEGVQYDERPGGVGICQVCTTPDDYYAHPDPAPDDLRVSIYKTCN